MFLDLGHMAELKTKCLTPFAYADPLPAPAFKLLRDVCKGLPLAIAIVGCLKRDLQRSSWGHVLEMVQASGGKALTFPDEGQEANYRQYTGLWAALGASVTALDGSGAAFRCLRWYAVLAEDTWVAFEVVHELWELPSEADTELMLRQLCGRSLVEVDEALRSCAHDLLRDYLKEAMVLQGGMAIAEMHGEVIAKCGDNLLTNKHAVDAGACPLASYLGERLWHHIEGSGGTSAQLAKLRRLCTLSLRSIGDEGAQALGAALGQPGALPALQTLYLSSNSIGDAGAQALGAALGQPGALPALRQLSLLNNSIGAAGAQALGAALGQPGALPALQQLSLLNNSIGAAGAQALGAAVGQPGALPALQALDSEV